MATKKSQKAAPPLRERVQTLSSENLSLREEIDALRREADLLREISISCAGESDYRAILQMVAERALDLVGAETSMAPIADPSTRTYSYLAAAGSNAAEIRGECFPIDFGVCGWVWRNRKTWSRSCLSEFPESERALWAREAETVLLVPLEARGRSSLLGGIAVQNKAGGHPFTERDARLLETLAALASGAIETSIALREARSARSEAEALHAKTLQLNRQLSSANSALERLSLYDALTGLPNRTLLSDRLAQEIFQSRASSSSGGLLLIDLDDFSDINDTLGAEAGDQILLAIASRLIEAMPLGCTIARLGGDEFAVLYPSLDPSTAMAAATELLDTLETPILADGLPPVLARASVGLALWPSDGDTPAALLRHAEAAMYAAKRDKLGAVRYDPSHEPRSTGRVTLAAELREAILNDQFVLHFQPKARLPGSSIVGCEALARWNHPSKGFIPPDMFIASLEHAGLIHDFTLWALGQAIWTRSQWIERGLDLRVSVNVPVSTLVEPRFQAALADIASENHSLDGIVFEITETLFLSDFSRMAETFSLCRSLGVEFSIDDFGTGHSSLSRLRDFPVSEIKIDKSFVLGMMDSKDDLAIVRSTIDLARNLGVQSVAEGVETPEALQALSEFGCDFAQGFLIGRPMPADDFFDFVRRAQPHP